MSAHLQWAIINKFNCYDIKKTGTTLTKEPSHLKGKKPLKYNTLVNPGSKSLQTVRLALMFINVFRRCCLC